MPFVFVHGVNNRLNEEYRQAERERNAFFTQFALANVLSNPGDIVSPYWGALGSTFAWNHGCLPADDTEKFGQDDDAIEGVIEEIGLDAVDENTDSFLLGLAKRDFARSVDLLFAVTAVDGEANADALEFASLADAATRYAEENPNPAWLQNANLTNDIQFVDELSVQVDEWRDTAATETFGIGDAWERVTRSAHRLREAAGEVWERGKEKLAAAGTAIKNQIGSAADATAGALSSLVVPTVRPKVHLRFAYFVGDVLVYMNKRGSRGNEGDIVTLVGDAIEQAASRATANDPLIVLAHSMGGPICYDILTHFRPDVQVDLFLTVGSQVAYFEEAKLYRSSSPEFSAAKGNRVPQPANIKQWVNVFDPIDPVGFAVEKVFDGPNDFKWATGTHVGSAHSYYFVRPSFHRRLGVRIAEAFA